MKVTCKQSSLEDVYISEYFNLINYKSFVSEYKAQYSKFLSYIMDILHLNVYDITCCINYIELEISDFTVTYVFEHDENYILTHNCTIHHDATFEKIQNLYDSMSYIKKQLDDNIIEFKQQINMLHIYYKNYENFHEVIHEFFSANLVDLEYDERVRCLKLKVIELC